MISQQTSPDQESGAPFSRRQFLTAFVFGAVALGLTPLTSGLVKPKESLPIFLAAAKFARAVGGKVISASISEYVRRYEVSRATASEVYWTNTEMAQNGRFTNLAESKVYSPEEYYFFYPVTTPNRDNTCVAFFDLSRAEGSRRVSLIEGPTLLGISETAEKLADHRSAEYARRVFLPREKISDGTGSLRHSYARPDIYRSEAGIVRANYRTDGKGSGWVTVEARNERGILLGEGTYSLAYE